MNGAEFVQSAFRQLRREYEADLGGLTQEQLAWSPGSDANPIGAIHWHCMRILDGGIHQITGTQNIFERDKWQQRLNLNDDTAGSLLNDETKGITTQLLSSDTNNYSKQVWDELTDYLASLTDEELDRPIDPANPRRTVAQSLSYFNLQHVCWHLGEIKYIRGLQGINATHG
jgi:hypothetical protein